MAINVLTMGKTVGGKTHGQPDLTGDRTSTSHFEWHAFTKFLTIKLYSTRVTKKITFNLLKLAKYVAQVRSGNERVRPES